LVEFVLRNGDIDDRIGGGDSIRAMREGTRIHRMLQRQGGKNYHAEVPLRTIVSFEDYDLMIEGRADGLIYVDDPLVPIEQKGGPELPETGNDIFTISQVTVDEIKGVYRELDLMTEPEMLHLAQAKCYAYMVAKDNNLDSIDVRITYCNMDTEEVIRFLDNYTFDDLKRWFTDVVALYRRWSDFSYYFRKTRNDSIHMVKFPFEYREGQYDLAKSVYQTISENKLLYVQAPTGTGKTISTVFPAIKAVGENLGERIFYLTAKTITRTVARDTISLLAEQGYRAKTVIITAKDKLCPLDERRCNPEACPYAKGHFDRINDAVYDALMDMDIFDADTISKIAEERQVCPFELNLDISSWCDNIICDYNYVFDPNVYLKRFFSEGIRSEGIFLIDEAHNLVDRGREMYSETLIKEDFLIIKKNLKIYKTDILKGLNKCNRIMLEYKKQLQEDPMTDYLIIEDIDRFIFALTSLSVSMDSFFDKLRRSKETTDEDMTEILEFYFRVKNFLNLTENMSEGYEVYGEITSEGEFALHLFCVDPSGLLQERLNRGVASVFFSATLLPVSYYKSLLCKMEDPYAIYAKTAFSPSQSCIVAANDVTSRYKKRSSDMYERYAGYIREIVSKKQGNYMVFFPSYKFMEDVRSHFEISADWELICQERGMREGEKDEFLQSFSAERDHTLIGFCVLGGAFSEGIDLTNDRLIGAIIVGAGLPQVCSERRILSDHFDKMGLDGFSYAYLNPGMNKVMQAAGRVIRTIDDRGVIALLDDRFSQHQYSSCFPAEWDNVIPVTIDTVGDVISSFWN
ncbi:MAG: ATP-dependent DNA helicase, partial [Lachnospiraceae bacterium]|nr:ATP-dependent DNA helicase [Lachnospiraceae bacterium]